MFHKALRHLKGQDRKASAEAGRLMRVGLAVCPSKDVQLKADTALDLRLKMVYTIL